MVSSLTLIILFSIDNNSEEKIEQFYLTNKLDVCVCVCENAFDFNWYL